MPPHDSSAEFFRSLTGHRPFNYQARLRDALRAGENVILRAPTGAGKTWAAVAPFLEARGGGPGRFADRLIYALPLRSLASALHAEVARACREQLNLNVETQCRERRYLPSDPVYITLQMGGQCDDPFLEGDLIFTTIDQLLSNYLLQPASVPARVGNIGAAALIGSFIVLDEFHLLDPAASLATAVEMLDRLGPLARFLLMSATVPDAVADWLAQKLRAKTSLLQPEDLAEMPAQRNKRRCFAWSGDPLTAATVKSRHRGGRTLAILNTVGRAQQLFSDLEAAFAADPEPPELLLLHSRFFPGDRSRTEARLLQLFGKSAPPANAVAVATQTIEAGLDISAEVLLSELAPMNAILQRAGRCARFADRPEGVVWVHELPPAKDGTKNVRPYPDDKIIASTRRCLSPSTEPLPCDAAQETAWLNAVHQQPDLDSLHHLDNLNRHRKLVSRAMVGEPGQDLIRQIAASVSLLITDSPESVRFDRGRWPTLLSVPRSSLLAGLSAASAPAGDWVLKTASPPHPDEPAPFTWRPAEARSAGWLVAVHPRFARYHQRLGLEIGKPSDAIPAVAYLEPRRDERRSYNRETWRDHSERVAQVGARVLAASPSAAAAFAKIAPPVPLAPLLDAVCRLHDVGKLTLDWQGEARRWQSLTAQPSASDEPLAHTQFDAERDANNPNRPRFPHHAAEGAVAAAPVLAKSFAAEAAEIALSSIARHHGGYCCADKLGPPVPAFRLVEGADRLLAPLARRLSAVLPKLGELSEHAADFKDCLYWINTDEGPAHVLLYRWALYCLLSRWLRLSDQRSFAESLQ